MKVLLCNDPILCAVLVEKVIGTWFGIDGTLLLQSTRLKVKHALFLTNINDITTMRIGVLPRCICPHHIQKNTVPEDSTVHLSCPHIRIHVYIISIVGRNSLDSIRASQNSSHLRYIIVFYRELETDLVYLPTSSIINISLPA